MNPSENSANCATPIWPWLLLPARLVLFAFIQSLIALIAIPFVADPWQASIAWWPLGVTLANLATIALLVFVFRIEGRSYTALFRIERGHLRADLKTLAILVVPFAVLAIVPNMLLAGLFFGSPQAAADMFIAPLPFWVATVLVIAFPVSIALAELPLYFGYVMPRLERQTARPWVAIALPALFAAAQHVTMPLIFDWRFAAWRLLMFVPFTVFLGLIIRWRPRLLPWLVIGHGLLDVSLIALMF